MLSQVGRLDLWGLFQILGSQKTPRALGAGWCWNVPRFWIHGNSLGAWCHGKWLVLGCTGSQVCGSSLGTRFHRSCLGLLKPSDVWVGLRSKFVEVQCEPPSITGIGLLLGSAGAGFPSEAGCSLHSPSSMGRVSFSILGCLGLGEGSLGHLNLSFLASSMCLLLFLCFTQVL